MIHFIIRQPDYGIYLSMIAEVMIELLQTLLFSQTFYSLMTEEIRSTFIVDVLFYMKQRYMSIDYK